MLFGEHLVVIRGGGDLGTGVTYQLHQAGFPVIVLEKTEPMAIRGTVALASAIYDGKVQIEGLVGIRFDTAPEALGVAGSGVIPVLASPTVPEALPADVVVDARLAKRNIDETRFAKVLEPCV